MKTESQTLVFVIHGEFVTKQSRSFWWDEGEKDRALKLLASLDGITTGQSLDVIFGKSKLTGDSKSGIFLEPDKATTSPCGNRMDETLIDTLREDKEKIKVLKDDLRDHLSVRETIASKYGAVEIGPRALKRLKRGEETIDTLGCRGLIKKRPIVTEPLRGRRELLKTQEADGLAFPGIADAIEEVETPPKPDPDLNSQNGWVDREGRFFPCGYGGHIRLADLLGLDAVVMEDKGWVKITDYTTCPIPIPAREFVMYEGKVSPTVAQKKVVVDWCTKYERAVPEWVTE